MRTFLQVKAIVSEDNDQLSDTDPDVDTTIDDSTVIAKKASTYQLAASSSETQYTFGPEVTNAKYLLLQVLEGTITWRFNNSSDNPAIGLTVDPAATQDPILPYQANPQPGVLVVGPMTAANPLTTLYVHNPSTTAIARIAITVIGEAV